MRSNWRLNKKQEDHHGIIVQKALFALLRAKVEELKCLDISTKESTKETFQDNKLT